MTADMKAAICIVAALSLIHVATAADYVLGSPAGGWGARTDQVFVPGDTITFKYSSFHNVVEVTKDAYDACSAANPITSDNSGSTTVVLAAPGKRYFICGAPGHCQSGMKLEVDVADRPAPTAPSPPPLPPPPPPRHAKRGSTPAPLPLPPAPTSWSPAPTPRTWSPAPAPAPAAAPPRHARHRKQTKHRRRHGPPKSAPARAPTVESVEADFPVAALTPMSSPPPPPPMSSDAASSLSAKWGKFTAGIVPVALVFVVLAL